MALHHLYPSAHGSWGSARPAAGRAADAAEALREDIKNLGTKGKSAERALIVGRENARKRIEKVKENMAIRKPAAPRGSTALGSCGNNHRHTSPSSSDIACYSLATPVSAHWNVATDAPVITVDWLDEACGVWPGRLYRILAELASDTPNGVPPESSAEPLLEESQIRGLCTAPPKVEFLADGVRYVIQLDTLVRSQVPKIIEVSWLVPRPVEEIPVFFAAISEKFEPGDGQSGILLGLHFLRGLGLLHTLVAGTE